jgi:hypothetical protein
MLCINSDVHKEAKMTIWIVILFENRNSTSKDHKQGITYVKSRFYP